jgi:hypothetical protein
VLRYRLHVTGDAMTDRELMQMALDALDTLVPQRGGDIYSAAAQALRDRLAQPEWVGLTDEEIQEMRIKTLDSVATNYETYKAIEAKLKEKNT